MRPAVDAMTAPPGSDSSVSLFVDVLRSEFCKFRSVRATFWTLSAAAVFNVAAAALLAIFLPGALSAREAASVDSTRISLGGLHLSQVAIGVLGVLIITSEYTSGMIRASLSAVPRRRLLLAAKTLVFTSSALVVGAATSYAAYLVFQAFLPPGNGMRTSLGDAGVLRAVTGAGLYLTVLGLFGLGLGAIIRSSAGAIATLFGLLFVPPLLAALLPASWRDTVGPYLPMQAGTAIYTVQPEPGALAPWTGFGVFCLYAAGALVTGFILIKHRDA
jgi:ABC-2 type transport system permease protein